MSVLSRNLELLAARYERLGRVMQETVAAQGAAVFPARSGEPSLAIEGTLAHSRYDPRAEGAKLAASMEGDLAVFLGFGLGYQIEESMRLFPERRILVIEADPRLFRTAMEARDLSAIFSTATTVFMIGAEPDAILSYLNANPADSIAILPLRAATERNGGYYASVLDSITIYRSKREINENTLARFGRLWVRNLMRNVRELAGSTGIDGFAGAFSGIPALVLAAGPSLDAILPSLRELSERCLVICVDTALRASLRIGVEPDFVVVVDPQYWNVRHLDGLSCPLSILVTEPAAHPAVFRLRCRRIAMSGSIYPLGSYVEARVFGSRLKLGAGGSVATSAWDLARIAGCSPIYLAGLDLGYPAGATHARGSFFEERAHGYASRLTPIETSSFRSLGEAGGFSVPANHGGSVRTDRRMIVYKWWFEAQMREKPETGSRNLSLGVAISGIPPAHVGEVLERPVRRGDIDLIIEGLGAECNAGRAGTLAGLEKVLGELDESLASMEKAALEGIRVAGEMADGNGRDGSIEAMARALDEIDAALTENASKEVTSFLIPPARSLLGGKIPENLAEAVENSRKVYEEVAAAASFHRILLKRAKAGRNPAED